MSVLRVLDKTGDTAYKWDVKDKASVEEVRLQFESIVKKGYMAVRIDSPTKGEVIRDFDPTAKEIIVTRPMVGG